MLVVTSTRLCAIKGYEMEITPSALKSRLHFNVNGVTKRLAGSNPSWTVLFWNVTDLSSRGLGRGVGRGAGVGRGLGTGLGLPPVGVCVAVAVAANATAQTQNSSR